MQSDLGPCCFSRPFWQATSVRNLWTFTVFMCLTITKYSKCSKISNTFLFLFSNRMLVIRAGNYKMLVRIANREDSDAV